MWVSCALRDGQTSVCYLGNSLRALRHYGSQRPFVRAAYRSAPPVRPDWLHEVKHDGWRAQLHRASSEVVIFSKNGRQISGRFAIIRDALRSVPDCIIDVEIVGCDAAGIPDFRGLMAGNSAGLCAWCFDLLSVGGREQMEQPLATLLEWHIFRRPRPAALLRRLRRFRQTCCGCAHGPRSKKRSAPYVAGPNCGWVKVKTQPWRQDAPRCSRRISPRPPCAEGSDIAPSALLSVSGYSFDKD